MNAKTKALLIVSAHPKGYLEETGFGRDAELVWFRSALGQAVPLRLVHAREDPLPFSREIGGVIVGGSSASAYEKEGWIEGLKEFLGMLYDRGIPLLGICFGHQVLAEALGGKTESNKLGREFGFATVRLTADGEREPLFRGIPSEFSIAQSHGDVVSQLPSSTAILAGNGMSPYQAVKHNRTTFGVQFHPELGVDIILKLAVIRKESLIQNGCECDGRRFEGESGFGELLVHIKRPRFPAGTVVIRNFVQNIAGMGAR